MVLQATELSPHAIEERHEVRDARKLARLTKAMERRGWAGRPLLVVRYGTDRALTGSHRLAAARAAGLIRVPVLLIEAGADWQADGEVLEALLSAHDDDDRRIVLGETNLADAVALMDKER